MYIQRIATVYEPDVDKLPAEFRSVLTEQDIQAIRTGPGYFATLAGTESPKWLPKVLAQCAESGYRLQFQASNDKPYTLYYSFNWHTGPSISLPRPNQLRSDLPPFLQQIYNVIDSFRENGFDLAGGLHSGSTLHPISESWMWVEPGGPIDPASAIPFLESLSGSQLCYLTDGGGAWLEACRFRRVKNLEREVKRYFDALLKGTRI